MQYKRHLWEGGRGIGGASCTGGNKQKAGCYRTMVINYAVTNYAMIILIIVGEGI